MQNTLPSDKAQPAGVRLLRREDVPGVMRLKYFAGWNQSARDLERLLEWQPEGCFGIDLEGELAATATVMCYGTDLAWIGMVLTAPHFRGRGLARSLMQQCMDYSSSRGVGQVGLDATDMGIALYRRFGFVEDRKIERWVRPAAEPMAPAGDVGAWRPLAELDRRAFGTARDELLCRLAGEEAAAIGDSAYAMGRPGSKAAYFGPCVAESGAQARELLKWFLARHPGEMVYWDIFPDNAAAVEIAREFAFAPVRQLDRMYHRFVADVTHEDVSLIYGTAGFELG